MISGTIRRTALAAARQAPRRNFHATPARNGGYHYPEGPRSNLPFDPLAKGFGIKFIAYAVTGFGLPFGIAVWQMKKNQ
ncbi:hypothetical protein FPQ18DRAFT_257357 [Pyronema domesticum]|nr:hypothetical protein FPQ18DRAFT_257357 [Pyronema domesticum]